LKFIHKVRDCKRRQTKFNFGLDDTSGIMPLDLPSSNLVVIFLLWLQSYAPLIEKCQICDFCALKLMWPGQMLLNFYTMYLTTIHKSSLNELCPLINWKKLICSFYALTSVTLLQIFWNFLHNMEIKIIFFLLLYQLQFQNYASVYLSWSGPSMIYGHTLKFCLNMNIN
jgi:hypothetical protein